MSGPAPGGPAGTGDPAARGPGTAPDAERAALWEAAAVASMPAVRRAGAAAAAAVALAGLVTLVAGWRPAVSVWLGGAVVVAVLVASVLLLARTARRVAPALALGVAVLLYGVVVVGLFALAAGSRAGVVAGGLRPGGVAAGVLVGLLVWTAALAGLHLRAARPAGRVRGPRPGAVPPDRPDAPPDRTDGPSRGRPGTRCAGRPGTDPPPR